LQTTSLYTAVTALFIFTVRLQTYTVETALFIFYSAAVNLYSRDCFIYILQSGCKLIQS
jgi:hypothetical protein